jgi:hypothetical protein
LAFLELSKMDLCRRKIILALIVTLFGHVMVAKAATIADAGSNAFVGYLPVNLFESLESAEDPNYSILSESPWTVGLYFATETFTHPITMKGDPARVSLAIAAIDALAGQLAVGDGPFGVHPMSEMTMLQARKTLRSMLGIPATAPSQAVIDDLVLASQALESGDRAAALQQFRAPYFTKSSQQTLEILSDFPYVPIVYGATTEFSDAVSRDLH